MAKPSVRLPPLPVDPPFETGPVTQRFNLEDVVAGLVKDLSLLRAGKITVNDAKTRGELGKQILRGVGLFLQGEKMLDMKLLAAPPAQPEAEPEAEAGSAEAHPAKVPPLKRKAQFGRGGRRTRVVDIEAE